MQRRFQDREEAGRALAARLQRFANQPGLIVLGLPRGGVPVAAEVAKALGAPLDVFIVRKLGVPGYRELAMGAIASGGIRVLNREVIEMLGISERSIAAVVSEETAEVERREREYRGPRAFPDLHNATVILVDDGVATGSTMMAGVAALRRLGPATLVAAAPVMSQQAQASLARAADACECVLTPEPFHGVGMWYQDFGQTTDEEVRNLLDGEAAHARHD
jgi:predicted phosphoribosyltransferase